jgi:hypothetical protein
MEWRNAIAEIVAEHRRALAERPSKDELIAFHAGGLSEEDRERVLDHASWNPEVARDLVALIRFPEPPGDAAAPASDPGLDRRWGALRARLLAEGLLPETAPTEPSPDSGRVRFWARLRLVAAFAAGAALALVIGLLRSLHAPAPPQATGINLPIVELLALSDAVGDIRRGGEVTTLPANAGGLVLTLSVPGLAPATGSEPYAIEIRSGGEEIFRTAGLVPGEGGVFVLLLARDRLREGGHDLLLSDRSGQAVARFRLEVEFGP